MASVSVKVQWMGDQIKGQARKAAARGLLDGVEVAKQASLAMVPVETGRLRSTAYTDVDEDTLIGIVGYDDPRDVKTIKQHEDLSYRHPRGGQAKFLETPVRASGSAAFAKLAAAMRGALS